jgi:ABC-type glutathione transport system ATPase component
VSVDLLDVERVTKYFARPGGLFARGGERIAAVRDVSLAMRPREKLGIVGESGSGKTTLGRLVMGVLTPDAGQVRFDGVDVHRAVGPERQRLRRRLQLIFQDNAGALDPRLRIGESIAEPLRVHGVGETEMGRRAIVREWLERVGLDESLAARLPHELSGGQRQRVGVARALAVGPDLLVADEPVASLDVSIQTQILRLLADLVAATGVALFFISHDLRVVRALTERVLVLWRGQPVELGPTAEVIARPLHPYTRSLVDAVPALHPEARRILAASANPNAPTAADAPPATGTWREVEPGRWVRQEA